MIKHVSNLDIITVNRKLETAKELIRENTKRSLSKALSILRTISIWRSTEEQNKERNHLVKQIKQNLGAFAKVTSYKLMVKLGYELIEYTSTHILYVKEDAVKDKIYIRFDLLNQGVAKFNQDDKVLNILEMELPAINLFYSEREGFSIMKTEFKIGDRVRVKASGFKQNLHSFDIERLTPNLVGTLIAEEGEKLLIKFDGFKYGHSARNHFEERRLPYNPEDTCYWFVNSNQIEKVEE